MKLTDGMVVFWEDPDHQLASCYDILCDVDQEEGSGMLITNGTEVYLSECRTLTDDELYEYAQTGNTLVYPEEIEKRYGR